MTRYDLTPIEPLEIEINGAGQYAPAETVEEMIKYLTSQWPDKSKPAFDSALARSIDAMVFATDPQAARAVFLVAAHAAGMHVLPDDIEEMRKATDKKKPRCMPQRG